MKIKIILLLFSMTLALQGFAQNADESKIQFLLKSVENSKIIFLRNSKEHSGKEAREHLENKMNYARRAFWIFGPKADITVENFINKIASSSSTSGKEYRVRLKDGSIMTTNKWLRLKLKSYQKKASDNQKELKSTR
jgi:hypothetical protein